MVWPQRPGVAVPLSLQRSTGELIARRNLTIPTAEGIPSTGDSLIFENRSALSGNFIWDYVSTLVDARRLVAIEQNAAAARTAVEAAVASIKAGSVVGVAQSGASLPGRPDAKFVSWFTVRDPASRKGPYDQWFPIDPGNIEIGGVALGAAGAAGSIYEGYVLADGDDFNETTSSDFLTPLNPVGAYMTTRHYGVQSKEPRYLRGASSLGGYEADLWHSGFKDAGRGVVPASFADIITFGGGSLKTKACRAHAHEKAVLGPLSDKNNLSAMVHMGRRNMMRAPCIMEIRLRLPHALPTWNANHPTFWLLQSQPGNGFDGLELDCEAETAELQFNRTAWTNNSTKRGGTAGLTRPVSKTEYRNYAFEILQVAGAWKVRLWEDGALVAEIPADVGGVMFNPARPFHLMMTSHILQGGINQNSWNAAGDAGAEIECDWWRTWMPPTGKFRTSVQDSVVHPVDLGRTFSLPLLSPQQLWGSDVDSDVIEMIPNEDNTPAQPWVRELLPPSVTRTGNTLAGRISDHPGRLILARSTTPALGDGCVPQPITICVGPRINLPDIVTNVGKTVRVDVFAACDCGDLHMGKKICVTGLAGTGLSCDAQAGVLTGSPVLGVYSLAISVTNSEGQTATATVALEVEAALEPPAYEAWAGPDWLDASDIDSLALVDNAVTGIRNKRDGSWLEKAGAAITLRTGAYNGFSALNLERSIAFNMQARFTAAPDSPLSAMFHGEDRPCTVIAVYALRDVNTGLVWSASSGGPGFGSVCLIRRSAPNMSIRVENPKIDVSWGSGQPAGAVRIVAARYTGTHLTVWDTSLSKAVNAAAQEDALISAQGQFRIGTAATTGTTELFSATMSMDLMKIVVENSPRSDADVTQAITDLAAKWGVTLS